MAQAASVAVPPPTVQLKRAARGGILAETLDRGLAASRASDARAAACAAGRHKWRGMSLVGVVQTGGCISACWTGAARA